MKSLYCLLAICLLTMAAFCEEWHVDREADNMVTFTSSIPLLTFTGATGRIDGYLYWEGPEMLTGHSELLFEVDLNSLETGIGKRDRDMRDDVLETGKWPFGAFMGTIGDVEKVDSSLTVFRVVATGKMSLHGKKKSLQIPALITIEDDRMTVEAQFSIFLKDYDIEAPKLMAFIKVAEEIIIDLKFYLARAG